MRRSTRSTKRTTLFSALLFAVLFGQSEASSDRLTQEAALDGGGRGSSRANAPAARAPWYGRSYALLIGVSDYSNGWDRLPSVPAELDSVESVLSDLGFEVQQVHDPDADELKSSLRRFVEDHGLDSFDDRLLVFFAGHGHTETLEDGRERGYLVPADAPLPGTDLTTFKQKAMSMAEVRTEAEKIEAKHALFVFDSCFSGSIFKTRGSESSVPPQISSRTSRPVRQFITAGRANETVPAESLFTPTLVSALRGDGDLNGDGYVTGTELGDFLQDTVIAYQSGQTPQHGKINDPRLNEGDVVFRTSGEAGLDRSPMAVEELANRRSVNLRPWAATWDMSEYVPAPCHGVKGNWRFELGAVSGGPGGSSVAAAHTLWGSYEVQCKKLYKGVLRITYVEEGLLEGIWQNLSSGAQGTFSFAMNPDGNSFSGTATRPTNSGTQQFVWSGKRREE